MGQTPVRASSGGRDPSNVTRDESPSDLSRYYRGLFNNGPGISNEGLTIEKNDSKRLILILSS